MPSLAIFAPTNGIMGAHLQLPTSKSLSNRALLIAALCQQPCTLHHLSDADDTRLLAQALHHPSDHCYVGAGGTTLRFLTAYSAIASGTRLLSGTPRLHERPIADLVNALRHLGADISYVEREGYPPLRIKGKPLQGGNISINAQVSSQFITALLLIAPTFAKGLTLHLDGEPVSKPYIEMTMQLMRHFGAIVAWQDNSIVVEPQNYCANTYNVESDWSAASYLYAVAALSPKADIFLDGLHRNSWQGDSQIAAIAAQYWAVQTHYETQGVRLQKTTDKDKTPNIMPCYLDFAPCPDLAQTVAVVHAALNIPTAFGGLQTLRHKETDRIAALNTELQKINYSLQNADLASENPAFAHFFGQDEITQPDTFYLLPQGELPNHSPWHFETYDDHRMAMALAPLALRAGKQGIVIHKPEVVSKSYPNFWRDWASLGFVLQEV
jgi:3-phosphoshikimate 1-carboxyvinyltransferase